MIALRRGDARGEALRQGRNARRCGHAGGRAARGATVTIFGGCKATGLKRLGKATVGATGRFAFKAKSGTFFRAARRCCRR